jgi:peptidoglycan/LPS O-acetylase OafA/YrhL
MLLALIFAFVPLVSTLLFGLLILVCAEQSRQRASVILENPFAVWLGEISYSLYMIHILSITSIVLTLRPLLNSHISDRGTVIAALYISSILGSVILAAILYHLVERPSRKAITAFASKTEQKT